MTARDRLSERQQWIMRQIQQHGFATIEAMAQELGVSGQTIRRELIALEQSSHVIRFHGGAGLHHDQFRVGYAQKLSTGQAGKQRIGAMVAGMIPARASVYLDVGSTVEAVARALLAHKGLRVTTASAAVAMILAKAPGIEVFVTGGRLGGANGALTGPHALEVLARRDFDFAITSFGGFGPDGQPTDFDPEKIALRQAAFARSARRVGVIDATKFDKQAISPILGADRFTDLVTDAPPPNHILQAIKQGGGQLWLASDAAKGTVTTHNKAKNV